MGDGMSVGITYSPWRELYWQLFEYDGDAWNQDVLLPWTEANQPSVRELSLIGHADARRAVILDDPDEYTPLEALYVLSRILDVLIAPYQWPAGDPEPIVGDRWEGRLPAAGCYEAFCESLGCRRITEEFFHPFVHEIVTVIPADDPAQPPCLEAEHWPGFFSGSLLLARAGVTVRAGAHWLTPAVAEHSTLYWAWWRRNRSTHDRSHGWGGNSQWRTDFRRDYWADGQLYYNVDAARRSDNGDLPLDDRIELLRYRCSTIRDHGPDASVWETHWSEPSPRRA